MRKTLLSIAVIIFMLSVNAQVYMTPEDFSGSFPPDGWIIQNGGGDNTFEQGPMPATSEPTCTWIENSSNIEIDDRIITPEIVLPEGSEAKFYAQLRGSVGWAIAQYWDPDNLVRYFVEISTDGGSNWEVLLDLDNAQQVIAAGATFPWPDWSWFDIALDLSGYAGQTVKIAFHHEKEFVPQGGGSYGITNMGVWEDIQNDAELVAMEMANYSLIDSEVEIEGSVKNIGSNEITSFEAEYHINGELAETFTMEGLGISSFEIYTFDAGIPATFSSVEIYSVDLIITKINGGDDPSPENNILSRDISIASELTDRLPLFEVFTSSTCGPCVQGNEILDNVLNQNAGQYSLVKNQVNWPGSGDPYFNEDCGIRVDYYEVSGVPTLKANGLDEYSAGGMTQSKFNEIAAVEAYVEMDLAYVFDGLNVDISGTVSPNLNIEDASVQISVVEKTTYNNVGSNGETEFHNVMMKMLPDGNGSSFNLEAGVLQEFSQSSNLITTFIEEFEDLMVVAWVQDNTTHTVLQSVNLDMGVNVGVGEDEKRTASISPNPSIGNFTIQAEINTWVQISDITGKLIYNATTQAETLSIDLSGVNNGVYIVKLIDDQQNITIEKLLINN